MPYYAKLPQIFNIFKKLWSIINKKHDRYTKETCISKNKNLLLLTETVVDILPTI